MAAIAAFAAGCGTNMDAENPSGRTPGGSEGLVAERDVARVLAAIQTVDALCQGAKPSRSALGDATTTLVDVWRLGPKNILKYGSEPQPEAQSMQTVVVLQARRLRRCGDPTDAAHLTKVAGGKITATQP